MRIGFTGASGTGKSTLAEWVAEKYELEFNPVGSRPVAKAMGFDNPYDVDKAGKRAEFQRRLLDDKVSWELEHESFVTDRTTFDNLLYTALHDIKAASMDQVDKAIAALQRYDLIIYCPLEIFCNIDGDPNRVAEMAYHRIYDAALCGFFMKFDAPPFTTMLYQDLDMRKQELEKQIKAFLGAGHKE